MENASATTSVSITPVSNGFILQLVPMREVISSRQSLVGECLLRKRLAMSNNAVMMSLGKYPRDDNIDQTGQTETTYLSFVTPQALHGMCC